MRFLGMLVVALIGLVATGGLCNAVAETVLRARIASDAISLDPGTLRDENTDGIVLHMVEGLVAFREDGSVGPMLASEWTVSDEGKTYTFRLRKGITFHNGAPFTSSDVQWSFTRYMKPATHWRCRSEYSKEGITRIQSIDTPDPYTVVFRLTKAAPLFLKTLARTDCGESAILQRDSVGPDGVFRTPIGTGPFQFAAWKRNQYVELTRFTNYVALPGARDGNCGGKHALVDRVRFLIIPDGSAARVALLRGSIDVLDNLNPTEVASVKGKPGVDIQVTQAMDMWLLMLESKDLVLQDVRLRRAIALSIDVAGLTRVVTMGTAKPNSSPIPNVSPFHGPVQAQLVQPNLEEARRLVKESGYKGQPIQLITNRQYQQMFDAAILIQAMTAEVGINMQIDSMDWAAQQDHYIPGNYQAMAFSFSSRLDPSLNFGVLIGDRTKETRKVWDTPRSRELLALSVQTDDMAKRQFYIDELQRQFAEDVPAVILYNSSRISAVRSNVTGFKEWLASQQRLWDVAKR